MHRRSSTTCQDSRLSLHQQCKATLRQQCKATLRQQGKDKDMSYRQVLRCSIQYSTLCSSSKCNNKCGRIPLKHLLPARYSNFQSLNRLERL